MRARVLVAIDGPAGAGKSTVAKLLASRLDFLLVDTGALYRTVALAAQRAGLSFADDDAVGELAESLAADRRIRMEAESQGDSRGVRVLIDAEDVSSFIRTPEMSLGASRVSANPRVRDALLAMQRQAGENGGVVLEGRDIGTVVFPDAEVKFYLTAASTERAQRRMDELLAKGSAVSLEETLADVNKRDRADTERPIAPLRQAEDAHLVDSTGMPIEQVVDGMVRIVLAKNEELRRGRNV
jgi:cytidylate kinase